MTEPSAPILVSLELDPCAEPLSGKVCLAGETPRRFVGWMELAHAIDLARRRDGRDRTSVGRGPGSGAQATDG